MVVNKCKVCGKEVSGKYKNFCGNSCYSKWYYMQNREKEIARVKARYIYHPRPKLTEEEVEARRQKNIEKSKQWHIEHREKSKEQNRAWYARHKDDESFKARHKIAMKKYYEKTKKSVDKYVDVC